MFCPNCGKYVENGDAFCGFCGKPLDTGNVGAQTTEAPKNADAAIAQPNSNPEMQYYRDQYTAIERPVLNRGLTAIVGYLGWLGFLIAMVGGDRKEKYARYHLGQSLLINIVLTVSGLLCTIGSAMITAGYYSAYVYGVYRLNIAGAIITLLGVVAGIYTFVCWILGLIRSCRGSLKPLPIFGRFRILK